MSEKDTIVYIADIDQDIDDLIAIEYLYLHGYLDCVVLDGTGNNNKKIDILLEMGIKFEDEIPLDTDIVFCGGAFTKVKEFVTYNKLRLLVANGGYVGSNIIPITKQLKKFRGKDKVSTFNLNLDINSAIKVLDSPNIHEIMLVSKNVCHSMVNTFGVYHKDNFIKKYDLRSGKRLHNLLMVKEGVNYLEERDMHCKYINVNLIYDKKEPSDMTLWGSELNSESNILISTIFK